MSNQQEKLASVNLSQGKSWRPGIVGTIEEVTAWLNLAPQAGSGEALITQVGSEYQAVQYF